MSKSPIDTEPVSPGELLLEDFLKPMGISQYRLAKETGIPAQRIGQIVLGRRSVIVDTDVCLCRCFRLTDGYWLRAQIVCNLERGRREMSDELEAITPLAQAMWRGLYAR